MSGEETHISVPENIPQDGDVAARKSKPMSGSQASQLKALSAERGIPADLTLTAEEAARRIDELQKKVPRVVPEP